MMVGVGGGDQQSVIGFFDSIGNEHEADKDIQRATEERFIH